MFGKAKSTISEHIKAIFEEGELDAISTVRNYRIVQIEGDREVVRDIVSPLVLKFIHRYKKIEIKSLK